MLNIDTKSPILTKMRNVSRGKNGKFVLTHQILNEIVKEKFQLILPIKFEYT